MDATGAIDATPKILDAIGQLKTEALILVAFLALCALVGWLVFLRNKRIHQAAADAAAAAAATADAAARLADNQSKERRAEKYAAALENLRVEIESMRKSSDKGSAVIQNLLIQQTATLSKTVSSLEGGHAQRQTELNSLMHELLDRQKGVINTEDSFRIIEINFRFEIKPPMLSLVEASIRGNHFSQEPEFVQERFLSRANAILFSAREALKFYSLGVPVDYFFPADAAKHYELADDIWRCVKAIHETAAVTGDPDAMGKRVQQAQLRVENLVNSFMNRRVLEVRNAQDNQELPGAGSGVHAPT
jgi:hypothetical protein